MVEIRSREDLEAWLKGRPGEDAVALAARAALRVLPLAVSVLDRDAAQHRADIVLPVFRAAAAPWLAATGPEEGTEVREAAAAASAAATAADDATTRATARTATRAAAAAASAAASNAAFPEGRATDLRAAFARAATRAAATRAASTRAAATRVAAWNAVSADADALEEGTAPEEVAALPLWPDAVPGPVARSWGDLSSHLAEAGEGWEVWTDWYEDRLYGRPFDRVLEEARVLIDADLWDQGPKAVNAAVAGLVRLHGAGARAAGRRSQTAAAAAAPPPAAQVRLVEFVQVFANGGLGGAPAEAEAARFATLVAEALAALRAGADGAGAAEGLFATDAFEVALTDTTALVSGRARYALLGALGPGREPPAAADTTGGTAGNTPENPALADVLATLIADLEQAILTASERFAAAGAATPPPIPTRTIVYVPDERDLAERLAKGGD